MTRVKRGVLKTKTRRNLLKQVKGYRFGRSTKEANAMEAMMHAGAYAFAHRRDKKGDMRNLWNVKINASVRPEGLSYSKFINALKKKNIEVDRKILADLAENNPETFKRVVAQVK
ncbi:MAG: 50S ribosomal protein L20 [bacterium]